MTYAEFMGARQLLAEERLGVRLRAARNAEDEQMKRGLEAVREMG